MPSSAAGRLYSVNVAPVTAQSNSGDPHDNPRYSRADSSRRGIFLPQPPTGKGLSGRGARPTFQQPFRPFPQHAVGVARTNLGQLLIADHSVGQRLATETSAATGVSWNPPNWIDCDRHTSTEYKWPAADDAYRPTRSHHFNLSSVAAHRHRGLEESLYDRAPGEPMKRPTAPIADDYMRERIPRTRSSPRTSGSSPNCGSILPRARGTLVSSQTPSSDVGDIQGLRRLILRS